MSRVRLAAPAVLCAALVAGCGQQATTSSTPELSPTLRVQAASDTTRQAGSSRFELTATSDVAGKQLTIKESGASDPARQLGEVQFSATPPGQAPVSVQERLVGGDLYVQDPRQSGSFYKLAVSDLVGTSLASSADPTAGFQALKAASSDVRKAGTELVRGTRTTHYTGTYDAKAALDKVDGVAKQLLSATLKGSDVSSVPFDAYIDDQGRVRKMVTTTTLTPSATAGQPVKTTTELEIYDFGTPVTTTAPPADQVKDGAALLASLKGAAPTS